MSSQITVYTSTRIFIRNFRVNTMAAIDCCSHQHATVTPWSLFNEQRRDRSIESPQTSLIIYDLQERKLR